MESRLCITWQHDTEMIKRETIMHMYSFCFSNFICVWVQIAFICFLSVMSSGRRDKEEEEEEDDEKEEEWKDSGGGQGGRSTLRRIRALLPVWKFNVGEESRRTKQQPHLPVVSLASFQHVYPVLSLSGEEEEDFLVPN